ncbi:MAG: helix-turn-helix domain-containing protein [Verrucomicrobia bacterium]|nr:helix-turn-helix domain-containing protein [Verrucomicrobiota bacterium]
MKSPSNTHPRPSPLPSIPDFCPACDATDKPFASIQRETEQDFRSATFRVISPVLCCRHCGFDLLGPGHLDALRLATHDAYRRQHGLLTAAEISARRKAMGISQKRFAAYLGVGSASIERWESGILVQDKASDLLIRERTDHTLFLAPDESRNPITKTVFKPSIPPAHAVTSTPVKTTTTHCVSAPSSGSNPYPNSSHVISPAA